MKIASCLKFVLFALLCLMPLHVASAGPSISGSQTAGSAGSNAKLACQPVKIATPMTIASVSGTNAGFWIQQDSAVVARYYKTNDPSAVGKVLVPGTYYVYPNLPNGARSASVVVTLK